MAGGPNTEQLLRRIAFLRGQINGMILATTSARQQGFPGQQEYVKKLLHEIENIEKMPEMLYDEEIKAIENEIKEGKRLNFRGPCKEHYIKAKSKIRHIVSLIESVRDMDPSTGKRGQRQGLRKELLRVKRELDHELAIAPTRSQAIAEAEALLAQGKYKKGRKINWDGYKGGTLGAFDDDWDTYKKEKLESIEKGTGLAPLTALFRKKRREEIKDYKDNIKDRISDIDSLIASRSLNPEEEAALKKEREGLAKKSTKYKHEAEIAREMGSRIFSNFRGHSGMDANIIGAIFIGVIGVILGALLSSVILVVAFMAWALSTIFPDAKEVSSVDANGNKITVWKGRGSAVVKAYGQMTALILGMYFLYTSPFPLSAFLMLVLGFAGYASFPVSWEQERTDEFIKSFTRMFLGVVVISIWIFGNLFQSQVLMWMGILFLAVPPLRRGKQADDFRAGGEDMFYRIFFLFGMGYIFYSVVGTGGWGLAGASLYVFYLIWGMSFVSGLFSAVEDMPKIGSVLLIVALILFGTTGTGQENIGTAMFGQWWPTVHNSVTNTLTPLGDAFSGFGKTFGAGWLMFTDPMGYATQIMDGSYAKNPTGVTGAYGLEIRSLTVDTIYPEEPFTIRYELNNMGPKDATAVNMTITSSIGGFDLRLEDGSGSTSSGSPGNPVPDKSYELGDVVWDAIEEFNPIIAIFDKGDPERLESHDQMASRNYWTFLSDQRKIERNDIWPVFMIGEISCIEARNAVWRSYTMPSDVTYPSLSVGAGAINTAEVAIFGRQPSVPSAGNLMTQKTRLGSGSPDALKYITFRVVEEYRYSTDSALQIKFISEDKWKELLRENQDVRQNVPSTMTSGPIKLNLGSMDQPIKAGSPFFIGFNISVPKPRTSIRDVSVDVNFPFKVNASNLAKCSKGYSGIRHVNGTDEWIVTWDLGAGPSFSVFCHFDSSVVKLLGPEKTFHVQANATYSVTTYEEFDTMTAFKDTCFTKTIQPASQTIAVLGAVTIASHKLDTNENKLEAKIEVTFDDNNGRIRSVGGTGCSEDDNNFYINWDNLDLPTEIGKNLKDSATAVITTGDGKEYDITVRYEISAKDDGTGKIVPYVSDLYIYEIKIHKEKGAGVQSQTIDALGEITIVVPKANTLISKGSPQKIDLVDFSATFNVPFKDPSSKIDTVECIDSDTFTCQKTDDEIFVLNWKQVELPRPGQTKKKSENVILTEKINDKERRYSLLITYEVRSKIYPDHKNILLTDSLKVYVNKIDVLDESEEPLEDPDPTVAGDIGITIIPDMDNTKINFIEKNGDDYEYKAYFAFKEKDSKETAIEFDANDFSYKTSMMSSFDMIDTITGVGSRFLEKDIEFILMKRSLVLKNDTATATYVQVKGAIEIKKTGEKVNIDVKYNLKISPDGEKVTITPA